MPFTKPANYNEDIKVFYEKIKNKEKFAFSKYADGELHIFANAPVNNGEFWFNPQSDHFYRQKMIESIKYEDENYYVGISCPCCIGGSAAHQYMKSLSARREEKLTWANLFVNSNYDFYLKNIVPLYSDYEVYLVSNDASNLDNLPFNVKKHFMIGKNAWVENYDLIDEISEFIKINDIQNSLFLFCAGPFGNLLSSRLHKANKSNTYLDIGSTLNPLLLGEEGKNRDYLKGINDINTSCVWEER
tara:strand:+ start:6475 stop:7209 length:735 start_codon:yes stop_codon:yes gene_type:complete